MFVKMHMEVALPWVTLFFFFSFFLFSLVWGKGGKCTMHLVPCAVCATPEWLVVGPVYLWDKLPSDLPTKTPHASAAQPDPVSVSQK